MPSPINKGAIGLLSLLDAQTQGKNPSILLDEIQGQLDLLPFYLRQTREPLNFTQVIDGASITHVLTTVPATEFWLVQMGSTYISVEGATGDVKVVPQLRTPVINSTLVLAEALQYDSTSVFQETAKPFMFAPFIAQPRDDIQLQTVANNIAAGSITTRTSILFTRFKLAN